jgi:hypothetical protein
MFFLTGMLLRFFTTVEAWDSLPENCSKALVQREEIFAYDWFVEFNSLFFLLEFDFICFLDGL